MRLSCRRRLHLLRVDILALFLLFTTLSVSQEYLNNFSPSAKSVGLGYSGVVDVYDASALYWNPAALSVARYSQGLLSVHEPYFINFISYSHFVPKYGSFAVSFSSTHSDSNAVSFGSAGWGHQVLPHFHTGISISGMQQNEDTWGTLGIGFLYKPVTTITRPYRRGSFSRSPFIANRLTLGLSLQNLPVGKPGFDHQIRLGASYKFLPLGASVVYAHHFMSGTDSDHLGLLFHPLPQVEVYTGMKNFDSRAFSFGAGFTWDNVSVYLTYDAQRKRLAFTSGFRVGPHPHRISDRYYDRALDALRNKDKRAALQHVEYALIYDVDNKKAADLNRLLIPNIKSENRKIDSLLYSAQNYQSQQRFLNAAEEYLKILKIDPQNAAAREAIAMLRPKINMEAERWYLQGVQHYENGEIPRAEQIFESIILVKPDHYASKLYLDKIQEFYQKQAEQHYFAGLGYYSQRKLDLAREEFEKALRIMPNYQDANHYLNRISEEKSQNINRINALLNEAYQKEQNGAWKSALARYQDVLRIQPDHAQALEKTRELRRRIDNYVARHYNRGINAFNNNDVARAKSEFATVLIMDPTHAGAQQYMNRLSARSSGRSTNYVERAQQHYDEGNWDAAIMMADSALAVNPNTAEAQELKTLAQSYREEEQWLLMAKAEYNRGNYLTAMEHLDKVIERNPENLEARELRETCQTRLNERVDEYFNRGIQLYTEEKYEEAIKIWDVVLRINPFHKGAADYKEKARERLDALESLP